ncbi:FIST C-terminal domain-containing protein [Chloroflexi bacterium TSY]|nr:FIST C-terminal domain-containing protein [Chloroflexi bacterium TSY]
MGTKAGVGMSHHRNPTMAGQEAAVMALQNAGIEQPDFVFMFASVGYDQPQLLQAVRETTKHTPLSGCSGEGVIVQGEGDESNFSVAVMVIQSNEMHFENGLATGFQSDAQGVGQSVATALQPLVEADAKGLFVFPDSLTANFDGFKQGLEETLSLNHFLPVLGGGASDNWQFQQTYQYCNDEIVSDGVAWALLSGQLHLAYAVSHGCMPMGSERQVTHAEGNILYEIDGKPTLTVFEEYLSPDEIADWSTSRVLFALGFPAAEHLRDQDNYIIRTIPGGFDEATGAAVLPGEVVEGSAVWMTRRDYDKIGHSVDSIAEQIKAQLGPSEPKMVFHFDCAGRGKAMLRDQQKSHLLNQLQQQVSPNVPWLGFYSYFEIGPMAGHNSMHNFTAVVAALYDGEVGQNGIQLVEDPLGKPDRRSEAIQNGASQPTITSVEIRQSESACQDDMAQLQHENQRLAEEVKRLIETERNLYATQEKLDGQYRMYRQLYEAGKQFNATFDLGEVLQVATQKVLYTLNFERCLAFMRLPGELPEDDQFQVQMMDGYYREEDRQAVKGLTIAITEPALVPLLAGEPHVVSSSENGQEALQEFGHLLDMDEGYILMSLVGETDQMIGFLAAGNTAEMSGYQTQIEVDSDALIGLANLASQASIAIKNTQLYAHQVEMNQVLQATNQQLESFAFSAAHTLKTDWQGVGYLVDEIFEILEEAEEEEEDPDIDEILEALQVLRPRVTKGIQTTDDLLTYARLGGQVNQTRQLLRPLVEAIVQRVDNNLVRIAADFPDSAFPLDEKTFPVALLQILENALTYGEGKPVTISLVGNQLRIQDQGRGIPPESLSNIFGLFQRAATDVKGTGVGLALSKQIALAHGFDIWAESYGEGRGSTFVIDFG